MRRITFWLLSTVSVLVLLFGYHTSTSSTMTTGAPSSIVGSTPSDRPSSRPTTQATASTVTGDVAQTQWGPVQVRLAMDGDTITKVTVLQYPNGNSRDDEINQYALPILVQETMTAQDASIDMVSGATVTSTGYLQSLQSALDRARA